MKILIDGYYGSNNLGDDFLLLSMLNKLSSNNKKSIKISVFSNGDKYRNLKSLYSFSVIRNTKNKLLNLISTIIHIFSNDIIIFGGGGLFPKGFNRGIYVKTKIAKFFRRKIYFLGIGIDSISSSKEEWVSLVKNSELFTVRDRESYLSLSSVFESDKIVLSKDLTFTIRDETEPVISSSRVIWGLAMPWSETEMKLSHYIKRYQILIDSVSQLVKEINKYIPSCQHVFVTFSHSRDIIIVNDVINNSNLTDYLIINDQSDLDYINKRSLFGTSIFNIVMRYHSLIFSIYEKTPFISISYSPKSHCLLEELELDEYSVKFGIRESEFYKREIDIDYPKISDILEKVIDNNREIRIKLDQQNKKLIEESEKTFELLEELIYRKKE